MSIIKNDLNFFEAYLSAIDKAVEVQIEGVASGVSEDYANYKEHVGRIYMLRQMRQVFVDLYKAYYKSD